MDRRDTMIRYEHSPLGAAEKRFAAVPYTTRCGKVPWYQSGLQSAGWASMTFLGCELRPNRFPLKAMHRAMHTQGAYDTGSPVVLPIARCVEGGIDHCQALAMSSCCTYHRAPDQSTPETIILVSCCLGHSETIPWSSATLLVAEGRSSLSGLLICNVITTFEHGDAFDIADAMPCHAPPSFGASVAESFERQSPWGRYSTISPLRPTTSIEKRNN
ncbi:hypothetical protein F4679DRAFT_63217 [Xylaria curta]|nr:hypothetical protein F4679DRAFT_63217 [Xylaria curta]